MSMKIDDISNSVHLAQYRAYERSSLERAEKARSDQERRSYLEIARGLANLAGQLERLYGVRENDTTFGGVAIST
jgi:hypothetical protein